ncbi:hypothetical protein [Arsenophonus nasoniae]|uniref:hypothetical protein n=1 Tax=Arsenophonus nasoniae TaxID=638 RepID=UPI001FE9CEA2|nr:hypothetical protein [Arsenophonus nasoniae]
MTVGINSSKKYGDSVSSWTSLSVERMLACGTCAMGVSAIVALRLIVLTAVFFCRSCRSKACSSCGFSHRAVVSTTSSYFTRLRLAAHYSPCHISFGLFFNVAAANVLCFGQPLRLCCS